MLNPPKMRTFSTSTRANLSVFLGLIFGILTPTLGFPSDFRSPRTEALGGAGHASPLLSDSIYLNSSFMPQIMTHALSFDYTVFGNGKKPTSEGPIDFYGHNMNISVVDGTHDALFQAGVGYTVREDNSMIHFGFGKQVIEKYLAVGLGGKFVFPTNNSGARYLDGVLSVTSLVNSWFQAAIIVDNVLETVQQPGFSRQITLGTKFNVMGITLLYVDPHVFWDKTFGYEIGGEFPFFTDFFLRMGGFKNSNISYQAQRGDGLSIGLGWIAPKISFDYAFSRVIMPITSLTHTMGVSIFF